VASPDEVDLTVYPDECDAFGHLNQASFLSLFERARWEMLARGDGMDLFTRVGTWPVVRKTSIDYHAPAFPGDILRFQQALIHHGRTSFTMRQTARRTRDDGLIATAEFVFVCVNREGRPSPVPEEFGRFMAGAGRGENRVTVNGVNLVVEVRGQGTAVLFIHGFPFAHTIWDHPVGQLERWKRIAPDLRGMGRSDAPDLGYSIGTYAEDLLALLDALDVEEAILCGLSMGGYIAFEMLRRARARISGLILMDTRAEADTADGKKNRDAAILQAKEGGAKAVAEDMLPKLLSPTTTQRNPALVERLRTMMSATPVAGMVGALGAMRDRPDSMGMLPDLTGLPTVVMVGADDQLTPPDRSRAMADAIPGARLEVVPNAGHVLPLEAPDRITSLIRSFVEGLDRR